MSTLERLAQVVRDGDAQQATALARQLVDEGGDATEAVDTLTAVMRQIGDRFATGEVFLPELMLAGRAMQGAMGALTPFLTHRQRLCARAVSLLSAR